MLFATRYALAVEKVAATATQHRALEIQAGWKAQRYTSLAKQGFDETFLGSIKWSSLNLTDQQTTKLRSRVTDLLNYFRRPDFETYYRLKTEGLHYRFSPSAWTTNFVANTTLFSAPALNDEKELVKTLWRKVHSRSGEMLLPRITSISLETLAATVSHTNSGRATMGGPVRQGFSVAAEALEPGFRYGRGDQALSPLLFEFSFLAKANESDVAGPLHISLLWSDEDHAWALNRLILDTWFGFTTLF